MYGSYMATPPPPQKNKHPTNLVSIQQRPFFFLNDVFFYGVKIKKIRCWWEAKVNKAFYFLVLIKFTHPKKSNTWLTTYLCHKLRAFHVKDQCMLIVAIKIGILLNNASCNRMNKLASLILFYYFISFSVT